MKIIYSNNSEIEKIFSSNAHHSVIYFQQSYHQFENKLGFNTGFVIEDDGSCMPFRIYKKWIFKFFQPLYPPQIEGQHLSFQKEKSFLNKLIITLKNEKKIHRVIQSFIMDVFQSFPDNSFNCEFGQLFLNLNKGNNDELFAQFQARYRSQIRSAAKDEASKINVGSNELNTCYKLYSDLHARQNMYYENLDYFHQLNQNLNSSEVYFYTGYYNDIPQCSALIIVKNKEAYYVFGGSIPKTNHPGIIKLMHWEIIKKMKSLGVEKYIWGGCRLSDVEGTKQQGMQEFKLRFGSSCR